MEQTTKPHDFFTEELALKYDERNAKLSRISDCLHFLTTLVLNKLPEKSRILCVGVGTGAEIFTLAKAFPQWTFVGVEPSESMLKVCGDRLKAAGLENRCELHHGFIQDLPLGEPFDATLSILVAHFVKHDERLGFFRNMTKHLKQGGYFVNAEISYDLNSANFPAMLKGWEQVQLLMGGTPESIANLPDILKNVLTVLPNIETESLIRQSDIPVPVKFFQAMMISAWFGQKSQL